MGWFALGKSVLKSKWVWIAVVFIIISLYVWRYTALTENLQEAYANLQGLSSALETTNKSLDNLRSEMERIDTYVIEQRQGRESIREELDSLKQSLKEERESNERLQECWNTDLGGYADRLRSTTTKD